MVLIFCSLDMPPRRKKGNYRIVEEYGELSSNYFTWEIPKFLELPVKNDYCLQSPTFSFASVEWQVEMHFVLTNGVGYDRFEISIVRSSKPFPSPDISYRLGFKTRSGKEFNRVKGAFGCEGLIWDKCILKRSEFNPEMKAELLPGGILTVFCHLTLRKSTADETSLTGPDEQAESPSVKKLKSDYKKLLEGGKDTDVCFVVSGKEFPAHRCIITSRSAVFEAMFNHETKEKISGKVDIEDLDPDSFQAFLEHVYTGSTEMISDKNVVGLYTAAEKYDVQTLKSECLEYMERELSGDSFCDILTFALSYNETNLMNLATEFFKNNISKIIETAKWQLFLSNNSTKANELLNKAYPPPENSQ